MAKKLLALFPTKKNAGCTNEWNALHDLPRKYNILLPSDGLAPITFPRPQRLYGRTEYADVTTKISRMESYQISLAMGLRSRAQGAPL